jgi:rRNA pseudouridine-1189 N-methylase Emg1 (Nep1/Mra1 family)
MTEDDSTFAVHLANYITLYSHSRRALGSTMSAQEMISALAACIALVVEQFPDEDQKRAWEHTHDLLDALEAHTETKVRETLQ